MHGAPDTITRYLPVSPTTRAWGWYLVDAGRQLIAPGARYPADGHPSAYLFDSQGRRTLDEFQIVYLAAGTGTFESASHPQRAVCAGDALLLFPGEWHCYRPDAATGWVEFWAGFGGSDAERVMTAFFNRRQPVVRVGHDIEVVALFERMVDYLHQPIPGGELVLASHLPLLLAFLRAGPAANRLTDGPASSDDRRVAAAIAQLARNPAVRTDFKRMAASMGVSYSRFRAVFKAQTGHSPRAFENQVRLKRARALLLSGRHNVSETAALLGFGSVYYFSRAFRACYGMSPSQWRAGRTPPTSQAVLPHAVTRPSSVVQSASAGAARAMPHS
jgi:AraC-like DNA-binding protein